MSYLNAVLRKYESLDVDEIAESSLAKVDFQIEELQRDQMMHGLNSRGEKIGAYRSEAYATFKYEHISELAGFGNVDLYRRGDFQRRITASIIAGELIIESTDQKTEALVSKYGEVVFGLSDEYANKLIIQLGPTFMDELRDKLL